MARRRNIKAARHPAMTINRQALGRRKLVYLAVSNKSRKYPEARSRVVYIGTTAGGIKRIAQSAADKAELLLGDYGVKHLDFYVVSCSPLRRVKTWLKLERGLLVAFKREYGDTPIANRRGGKAGWGDVLTYFSERRLVGVLRGFEQ